MYEVVFVCTGNQFRSALAAAFLRKLTQGQAVAVESYGILPLGGAAALPEAVELGRNCGVDLSEHRARSLAGVDLAHVDLVVGFEQQHVQHAVVDCRAARDRSFTANELADLVRPLGVSPAGSSSAPTAVVQRAAQLRRSGELVVTPRELGDPYGGSWKTCVRCARDIRRVSIDLATALFGVPAEAAEEALLQIPEDLRRPKRRFLLR